MTVVDCLLTWVDSLFSFSHSFDLRRWAARNAPRMPRFCFILSKKELKRKDITTVKLSLNAAREIRGLGSSKVHMRPTAVQPLSKVRVFTYLNDKRKLRDVSEIIFCVSEMALDTNDFVIFTIFFWSLPRWLAVAWCLTVLWVSFIFDKVPYTIREIDGSVASKHNLHDCTSHEGQTSYSMAVAES
jgi:hypothetical protein